MDKNEIFNLLETKYKEYNNRKIFAEQDPISIPYKFSKPEDIEIAAFITSTIAWGIRKSIINSATNILNIMQNQPHQFITNLDKNDLKSFDNIKHRTFNADDCKYFLKSLQNIYNNYGGLKYLFQNKFAETHNIIDTIDHFRSVFLSLNHQKRTEKHIANIKNNSASKKINMFLRWMVRKDNVDMGIWDKIPASALLIPLDVHSARVSRSLNLLTIQQNNLKAVVQLTDKLKEFDKNDPVKYDLALFGIGAIK